jgi:hypothetical protein
MQNSKLSQANWNTSSPPPNALRPRERLLDPSKSRSAGGRWRGWASWSIGNLVEDDGVTYIEELQDVIRKLHGVESVHLMSVPVHQRFEGKTVWSGIVEVFGLIGHESAKAVYAWIHNTDLSESPKRYVTVLGIDPIASARDAVRASTLQDFRNIQIDEPET